MKIWYQSALDLHDRASNYRVALENHFGRIASPGTEVSLRGRGEVASGLRMADIIGSPALYHQAITPVFINAVLEAQASGHDAFVVGTYSEPIIPELRSLSKIPVITMPEASMLLACSIAPKFALVTLSRVAVSYMYKTLATHRLEQRVSGVHVVDEVMDEEDLDTQAGDLSAYIERFRAACRLAIRQGAQAVIPAEGMMAAFIVTNGVTEVDGCPIVDPIAAPILFAELAVHMRRTTGLQQSRIAYPGPSKAGMKAIFGVDE
jgi:Asp/Glu/hydantoin racemase